MPNPLDQSIFQYSDAGDILTGRDAVEGLIILGAPGSGKTSAAAKEILTAYLRAGMGGTVISAKPRDAEDIIGYLHDTDRSNDLIHFRPGGPHCIDVLNYLWNRPGGGMLETIIEFIRVLIAVANPHTGSGGDRFFDLAANGLVRNCIVLLDLAKRPISFTTVNDLIDALPTQPGEFQSPEFQAESDLANILDAIRKRREDRDLTDHQWQDFSAALRFALVKWPGLYPETRTSIHATWSALCDQFLFSPLRPAFSSGKTTFIPEQAEIGKVIVCDWPATVFGETGRLIGCMWKMIVQLSAAARKITPDSPLVFLASDEAPLYLLPDDKDGAFQGICRESRVATVTIAQSISGISARLGEPQPGSKVKTWMGNIATKIFLQNNDLPTNEYASDLIGKEYRMLGNYSMTADNPHVGAHEHLDHTILPHEFTTLRKPDTRNPLAEAVVYAGGSRFRASGLNYLLTTFTR